MRWTTDIPDPDNRIVRCRIEVYAQGDIDVDFYHDVEAFDLFKHDLEEALLMRLEELVAGLKERLGCTEAKPTPRDGD